MKLELKHLAPYLPYDVQVYGSSEIWTLFGIDRVVDGEIFVNLENGTNPNFNYYREASMFEHSLILRPLSDLTKEIDVNGEKFVALHELAKLADVDTSDEEYVCVNNGVVHGVRYNIENDFDSYTHQVFAFDNYLTFGIHKRRGGNDFNGDIMHCPNQLDLWNKLYEWHFDIFSLIDNGLALDYNQINI